MDKRDYYEVLGLERSASEEEVRKPLDLPRRPLPRDGERAVRQLLPNNRQNLAVEV